MENNSVVENGLGDAIELTGCEAQIAQSSLISVVAFKGLRVANYVPRYLKYCVIEPTNLSTVSMVDICIVLELEEYKY